MLDYAEEASFRLMKKPVEQRCLFYFIGLARGRISIRLTDYIVKTGKFSQKFARTYVKQLIAAVHYLY